MKNRTALLMFITVGGIGCSAGYHAQSLHSSHDRKVTAGLVDAQIRQGMTQAEVAQVLGTPNITTREPHGGSTWIYDKVATESSYSNSRQGIAGLGGVAGEPGNVGILGGLFGNFDSQTGAAATTERTLTVVIRFDQDGRVSSTTYQQTSF